MESSSIRGPHRGDYLDFNYASDYRWKAKGQLGQSRDRGGDYYGYGYQVDWLGQLFPNVAAVPPQVGPKETEWPDEAVKLAASLLRSEKLRALDGGVEISLRTDTFDVRRDKLAAVRYALNIFSPKRWLVRSGTDGGPTQVRAAARCL